MNRIRVIIVVLFVLLTSPGTSAQSNGIDRRLEQAAALIGEKRIAEAEQQLNSILKVAPGEARSLNLLGVIRASQGRLDEAEALFTRAIGNDKLLVGAHMNLAYLYVLKGAPDKSISQLKAVLELDPKNAEALHKLARLLLTRGRYDECISFIKKSEQIEPPAAGLLILLGDAYLKKGDAEKAEETFIRALGEQRAGFDALTGLALASHLKRDAKSAYHYVSRAKMLAAGRPDLLYRVAMAALRTGIYEEARSALEQAIRSKPDEPAYYIALGAAWLKKPDLFEAEKAFRRALEIHPASPQGQMYLGYTLLKQKKLSEARDYLEKSVKSDPEIPEPFYYLALIAQEENDQQRAVDILEGVVRRFPSFANARIALGSSYIKLKNYPRAKQELELAVKLSPDEPKAHYNLAMLYARLKDPKRAQEAMQIVERLKSRGEQATDGDIVMPSLPNPR
jgi:tetratricopeptide (TPR) repeat protein